MKELLQASGLFLTAVGSTPGAKRSIDNTGCASHLHWAQTFAPAVSLSAAQNRKPESSQ
jgi:hypothetical protein